MENLLLCTYLSALIGLRVENYCLMSGMAVNPKQKFFGDLVTYMWAINTFDNKPMMEC